MMPLRGVRTLCWLAEAEAEAEMVAVSPPVVVEDIYASTFVSKRVVHQHLNLI